MGESQLCPTEEALSPCVCMYGDIFCGGNNVYNVSTVFARVDKQLAKDEKKFKKLFFNNTVIKELDANAFHNITFQYVWISNANGLERIHSEAFESSSHTMKEVHIRNAKSLINEPPNYNVFKMLASFVNLQSIELIATNITSIPANAMKPANGDQEKLESIIIEENPIKSIGNNAFSQLPTLSWLSLNNQSISRIPSLAFNFTTREPLAIVLDYNLLDSSSFAVDSLVNTKHEISLMLNYNNITYLNETIFESFFSKHLHNELYLDGNPLNCSDCANYWVRQRIDLEHNINAFFCDEEHTVFDKVMSQLNHCSSF